MQIEPNDLSLISRSLSTNSAVLFLGAGFSLEAKNASGHSLPTAEGLSQILWQLIGYKEPYDGSDLATVFQAALGKCRHDTLRNLLNETFTCREIPQWYQTLLNFWWHRIYTTNIDDLAEVVYRKTSALQRLDVINGVGDDFRERDQFLEALQCIKLNGTLDKAPLGITFSFRQYAQRGGQPDTWYDQFVRDYSTHVTIFVGTKLQEPLLWQAVEARGKKYKESENRPRSFMVCPHLSPVQIDSLSEFNVVGIQGTAKEFFEAISTAQGKVLSREEILLKTNSGLQGMFNILQGHISKPQRHSLEKFYQSFRSVTAPEKIPSVRKLFLLGAEPQWPDIYNNLDAPRQFNEEVLKSIEGAIASGRPHLVAITGSAGSGKSTLLKRTALTLSTKGHLVFFTDSEELPAVHEFGRALDVLPQPSVIFFDNASLALAILPDYLRELKSATCKHTLVIAGRTNRLAARLPSLKEQLDVAEHHIPDLTISDIDNLIDLLNGHNLLGKLANKPRHVQRDLFSAYAHRQILVAMRSATQGEGFDDIIKDEFMKTEPPSAALLYLCACLASDAGFTLSKQQLVAASDVEPSETLAFLVRNLRDLLIPTTPNNDRYSARHRLIAELIVSKFAPRSMLKTAYINLLRALSHDMPFPVNRVSAAFRLYRRLINHSTTYQRFSSHLDEARSIYEAVASNFQRDHHFWLQYGSLELEYGELDTAANYIEQAYSYAPDDNIVLTTRAQLLYKQACAATLFEIAQDLRDKARRIILLQSEERPKDAYPIHVYCTQELAWINHWLLAHIEKRNALEDLRQFATKAAKTHAQSKDIQAATKAISDAYLDLAK